MILVDQKKRAVKIEGYAVDLVAEIMVFEDALFQASPRVYAYLYTLMLKRSIEEDGILEMMQEFADSLYDGKELGA